MERIKLQTDAYKNVFDEMLCTSGNHTSTCIAKKIPHMPCINNIFSINRGNLYFTLQKVLTRERVCGTRNVVDDIVDINLDELGRILKIGFKNFIAMKSIECMFENKSFARQIYKDILSHITSEKFWMEKRETLGQGSYGVASTVTFGSSDIKFVCKIPLKEWNRKILENTVIEYFIGTVVVNEFRRFCPNFCYTVGSFWCNAREQMQCEFGKEAIFNFYEHIDGTHVSKISPELCAVSIIQLGLALERAQRANRFFHTDMSSSNIMISNETKQFSINLDNKTFVFNSPVVSILDYGMSSATINGVRIGSLLALNPGDPFRDVYNRTGFLLPGIDLINYIVSFCIYGTEQTAAFARWVIDRIFKKLGVPDPYNINVVVSRRALDALRLVDYFGKYSLSRVASLTPHQIIEILLPEKAFYDMVIPKYLKIEEITFYERGPSLYDFYKAIYKTPMNFDTDECIDNIKSYSLAYEIMQKITEDMNMVARLKKKMEEEKESLIEYDKNILLKFDNIQIPDSRIKNAIDMAGKCVLYNYKQRLTREDTTFLIDFMYESEFLDAIDKYLEIFMNIHALRIPEKVYLDIYNNIFLPSKQFYICITYGPYIRAGRRWAVTLLEKDY